MDIVTEVDQAVEKMVSTRLSAAFPSVAFMGEETYKPGTRLGPEPTFVVDPIDGMFPPDDGVASRPPRSPGHLATAAYADHHVC